MATFGHILAIVFGVSGKIFEPNISPGASIKGPIPIISPRGAYIWGGLYTELYGSLIHSSASCSATAGVCWVLTSIFPPTQAKLHAWAEVKHVHPLFGIG